MQNAIAEEVTTRVHSREDYEMAVKASQILFGKSTTEELGSIDERTLLSVFEGVPMIDVSKGELDGTGDIITLLSDTTKGEIFPSKGEARRMIQGGGVSINKEIVDGQLASGLVGFKDFFLVWKQLVDNINSSVYFQLQPEKIGNDI